VSTHPEHPEDAELIPAPAHSPEALRAALAKVAPHRLPEMEQQKNEVFALAVESGSIAPLRTFILTWAAHIEIARNLESAARLRAAEHLMQVLDPGTGQWREAARECTALFDHAYAKVSA
jgi:hypothetical protein